MADHAPEFNGDGYSDLAIGRTSYGFDDYPNYAGQTIRLSGTDSAGQTYEGPLEPNDEEGTTFN